MKHNRLIVIFFWHVSTVGVNVQSQTPSASVWCDDAEASASSDASASCYRRFEDVGVLAVIEAPRKFIQVERQITLRDVVIPADYATLEQTPERFQIVGMHLATDVLASRMIDGFVRQAHVL